MLSCLRTPQLSQMTQKRVPFRVCTNFSLVYYVGLVVYLLETFQSDSVTVTNSFIHISLPIQFTVKGLTFSKKGCPFLFHIFYSRFGARCWLHVIISQSCHMTCVVKSWTTKPYKIWGIRIMGHRSFHLYVLTFQSQLATQVKCYKSQKKNAWVAAQPNETTASKLSTHLFENCLKSFVLWSLFYGFVCLVYNILYYWLKG